MATFTPYAPNRWLIGAPAASGANGVFPLLPGQGFYAEKTPNWSTNLQRAASGRERATKMWSAPIWTFKVAYEVIRANPTLPELTQLYAFFNMAAGRFGRWFFYDPTDNTVVGQVFGTGDGVTTQFQLIRSFAVAGQNWTEPVRAPLGLPILYLNGVATTAFTLQPMGGVQFAAAPAAGAALTWSGQFYFLCRFDQDKLSPAQMVQSLWSLDGVQFCSVKP